MTVPVDHVLGASSVVSGAVSSILTVAVLVSSVLPTASVAAYAIVCVPSPVTAIGAP